MVSGVMVTEGILCYNIGYMIWYEELPVMRIVTAGVWSNLPFSYLMSKPLLLIPCSLPSVGPTDLS